MDSAAQDLLFQRINELIFDEEKIVTCMTAASELKIPLNIAKSILEVFVRDLQKLNSGNVHVTYLLCGSLKDGKGVAVYQVKEEDLENKKDLFCKESTVVYSVQKSKQIDFNTIALANATCGVYTGHLVSKNWGKRIIKSNPPAPQSLASTSDNSDKSISLSNGKTDTTHKASLKGSATDTTHKASPKGSATDTTHKASPKGSATDTTHKASPKGSAQMSQKALKPKQNGITSFFTKAPTKTESNCKIAKENIKTEDTVKQNNGAVKAHSEKQEKSTEEKINVDNDVAIKAHSEKQKMSREEKMDVDSEECNRNNISQIHTSNRKRKKPNKNTIPNKKRKRIQEICDSDSSDMFDDDENDIIEKSDGETDPVAVVPSLPLPKNKVRKAVDKTYVDEEGFIVTTTEYIYESVSEGENEKPKANTKEPLKVIPEKKNSEKETYVKKPPTSKGKTNKKPVVGKQSTLMNFFKKN